jgi:3'-phosphoadenosine 5'-phosphosulfate (PAPS) 3'-phosphatase
MVAKLLCLFRFVRGEQYAVGLALLVEGKVVLGVMACPNLPLASAVCATDNSSQEDVGCLFFATTGSGTYVQSLKGNSLPQKVSFTCPKLNHVINLQLFESVKEMLC